MFSSARGRATIVVVAINTGFLLLAVAADWPRWWENINYERSPLTWFSSVQLLAIACTCALAAVLARALGLLEQLRIWTALSAAFVFLALDERFQIHERLREGVLKPAGIGAGLPGVRPGDFIVLLYAAAGLWVCRALWRFFAGDRGSRAWLTVTIVLGLLATGIDAADLHQRGVDVERLQQFIEELAETGTQAAFLVACLRHALRLGEGVRLVAR